MWDSVSWAAVRVSGATDRTSKEQQNERSRCRFSITFTRGPADALLRISRPSSMGFLRQGRRVTNLCSCTSAQTNFLPAFSHGATDCRPILHVGGEDPCDQAMGKFGYETVQHHRRVTLFI